MVPTMKIVSVNVGLPRTVQWKGKAVSTGIFKAPLSGRIRLRSLNFDGDRQADLSVHGGPDKAAYVYASEALRLLEARASGHGSALGHFR